VIVDETRWRRRKTTLGDLSANRKYRSLDIAVKFRIARNAGVSGIDSHKPASVLISQACLRRHLSEMMDRIAKGPEDVKKSVRAADELP